MKQVMNVETGEIQIVELSAEEKEMQEKYRLIDIELKSKIEQEATAKQALLNKLGITEEEAKLLLS